MPIKRVQVALHNTQTNFARDDAVNVLYFDKQTGVFTDEGLANAVAGVYRDNQGFINSSYSGATVKVYDTIPGPPTFVGNYADVHGEAAYTLTEQCLCLSYSADDNTSGSPRRRGRIYVPYVGSAVRPSAATISQLLDMGQDLAAVGVGQNTTWMLHSQTNGTYLKIESISVDNAWDIQRRRGVRPTQRTRRDVQ